jgi:hypothetical protein
MHVAQDTIIRNHKECAPRLALPIFFLFYKIIYVFRV